VLAAAPLPWRVFPGLHSAQAAFLPVAGTEAALIYIILPSPSKLSFLFS